MNKTAIQRLEFDKVLVLLSEYAMSDAAKKRAKELLPIQDEKKIRRWLNETTEACKIIETSSSIPVHSLHGVEQLVALVDKGYLITPEQFGFLGAFLDSVKKIKKFMMKQEYHAPTISSYAYSLYELSELADEISRCIRNNRVDDYASKSLTKIRNKAGALEEKIKAKLAQIMKTSSSYLQEQVVSMRNGRYVVPVKNEYKRKFSGTILDQSSSGLTVYMEPSELNKLQDELAFLKVEEELEVQKILGILTEMTANYKQELLLNIEGMISYDFIFAKAKLSKVMRGNEVQLRPDEGYQIINARHPLLGENAVPLNVTLGRDYQALVITGPNTGGKTVTIKTIGLLAMMVQSGLHIPADHSSCFCIINDIFVDIGDHQSIEHSLSTFSSHIRNVIDILKQSREDTLIILDEIGSGTDPREGMGLAIAILEALYHSGAMIVATTHYSEIKEFAEKASGFQNGSMDFDIETLQPLYMLIIGKGGESRAFAIAQTLGMPEEIITRATEISYDQPRGEIMINPSISTREPARIKKPIQKGNQSVINYQIGDAVWVPHLQTKGIVVLKPNSMGEMELFVKGEKLILNHKRVKPFIEAKELYPDAYDLNQVFDNKEDRKKKKMMNRKHVEGLTIDYPEE
ncbi:endonuclease MutS2 [Metabacillus sediminilitoris]|uniref:Endonuclease MutS2 n=1 Tax=Metabacillus sediminilitoris TaxID=2567941 RepID=A0A4S4C0I0_9BACI|nr:endonuclease MutS2 [Metabacillus sediminilitoris]QGQ47932.1 endonuclease MutS2 [Metabacillus sediminilitoris]THF80954.1 endonuclease MutS2 [Metabacillus sediminilitoris]